MQEVNTKTVNLHSVLDISKTSELREQLLDLLESGTPTVLNAAEIERIDAAAMQLLSAYAAAADAAGIKFEWTAVSAALQEAAQLTGLADSLHITATVV
jgi:anti-anti-sigma factor